LLKIQGLILLFALNAWAASISSEPSIRVRIAKAIHDVNISGTDLVKTVSGQPIEQYYPGKKRFVFNCRPLKSLVKKNEPILLAKITSRTGLMEFNQKKYRGSLFLVSSYKGKGCDVINKLNLETYISSLLPKEMNAKWPLEALKAQAVAARSYAIHLIKTKQVKKTNGFETYYDLENSEKHQVNGSFFEVTYETSKATRLTRGQVLLPKSQRITPIFFHSKCGGKTRLPEQVWSNKVDGYSSVDCPYCHKHGVADWKIDIPKSRFDHALRKGMQVYQNKDIKSQLSLAPDDKSYPQLRLYSNDDVHLLKKSRIRSILGRKKAPSNYFKFEKNNNNSITLNGKGYGHGVGLCQFGAYEMAKRGYSYTDILAHYFPEMKLKKLY
tara:strand:+ start:16432 stop:17580 length:1149 start_codon:yes stop_codon:yes gene_type:complete